MFSSGELELSHQSGVGIVNACADGLDARQRITLRCAHCARDFAQSSFQFLERLILLFGELLKIGIRIEELCPCPAVEFASCYARG